MTCNNCKHLYDIKDLSSPYVVRTCQKCNRKIKLREPGEKGHEIKVEKGDQFILPQGYLKIAAIPLKGLGTLTRHGIEWFAKLIFIQDLPKKPDNLDSHLKINEELCDSY